MDFQNHPKDLANLGPWLTDAQIPWSVQWDTTWNCDLRCIHCYLTARDLDELTFTEQSRIIEELAQAGTMFLLFSGGDPFIRSDFLDLLARARDRLFDVRINTTGLRINQNCAKSLANLGISRVSLSLYGAHPESHECITLKKGTFDATLKAARFLAEAGVPLSLKTLVLQKNLHDFEQIEEIARDLGADWEVSTTIFPDHSASDRPCALSLPLPKQVEILKADLTRSSTHQTEERIENIDEIPNFNEPICQAGFTQAAISPNGNVTPCVLWQRSLGNLREQSFSEIWNSEKANQIRKLKLGDYQKVCGECGLFEKCAFCPGICELRHQTPIACDRFICELTQLRLAAYGSSTSKCPAP